MDPWEDKKDIGNIEKADGIIPSAWLNLYKILETLLEFFKSCWVMNFLSLLYTFFLIRGYYPINTSPVSLTALIWGTNRICSESCHSEYSRQLRAVYTKILKELSYSNVFSGR